MLVEEIPEVGPFRLRPDGGSDRVTFLEKGGYDVDGGEAVRAGDEDFTFGGDDWHGLLVVEIGLSVKSEDLEDEFGEGT